MFYALTPHVTFSTDGKTPLVSKAQLHSLRRSFCRSWWNDRWRDLLQGFVIALADGDTLQLDIGAESLLSVSSRFAQFASPVALVSIDGLTEAVADNFAEDEVGDEWDDELEQDGENGAGQTDNDSE